MYRIAIPASAPAPTSAQCRYNSVHGTPEYSYRQHRVTYLHFIYLHIHIMYKEGTDRSWLVYVGRREIDRAVSGDE